MNNTIARFTVAAFASALAAQQSLVLPDNHYLMESPTQLANTGVTTWWRTTAGRFQIVYEASHFIGKAGVPGPTMITRLQFRGEDGEPNVGGQIYSGVTVELGSTTLTGATLSTTFATNRLPATTTMGPLGTATVTVLPSVGSTPNNYCIDIDLVAIGAAMLFNPMGAQPNLLIDITMPTVPTGAPAAQIVPIQDTVATGAGIRGSGVTTATPASLTGTASASPPVVGLQISGPGGYATLYPARNERYGGACGGAPSTFYEAFQNGQAFDITGLTLTPDNAASPNFYMVSAGAPAPDLTKLNAVPNSTADDAVITHALGFTFRYPGSTTTTIKPCTNGFVWLDSAMTATTYYATAADMLGVSSALTARLMVCWHDFVPARNATTHPNCGLHVLTDTSGGPGNAVCYVTWNGVGTFKTVAGPAHADYTFQCVLYESTGVVEYRYGPMMPFVAHWTATALAMHAVVGFTRGRIGATPSVDPQSRDLSLEVPFSTAPEGSAGNMGQVAVAAPDAGGSVYGGRLFGGQSVTWNAVNVPVGSVIGVQLLDVAATRPGLSLPGITAPGCMLSTSPGALLWEITVLPPSTVVGTVPLVVPHGFEGTNIYAQYVVLDGLLGGPNLITVASNAIKHTIGLD